MRAACGLSRHTDDRKWQERQLAPRIARQPPPVIEQLALKLLGAPIDREMIVEYLDFLAAIRTSDNQLESLPVSSRTDLVHEVFSASMKAEQHVPAVVSVESAFACMRFCCTLPPC